MNNLRQFHFIWKKILSIIITMTFELKSNFQYNAFLGQNFWVCSLLCKYFFIFLNFNVYLQLLFSFENRRVKPTRAPVTKGPPATLSPTNTATCVSVIREILYNRGLKHTACSPHVARQMCQCGPRSSLKMIE